MEENIGYYENGQMMYDNPIKNGKCHGIQKGWHNN